ncbi:MAG: peptidylprolyl isomerase [bacterium]|nr:peptidylprolyl isomerase [bacterium]
MKKLLISILIVLVCVTGCGKVPKLENGQDAAVTLKNTDISIDSLYEKMKDKYALSVLLDMVDTEILNKEYKDSDEQKENIEAQITAWIAQFGNEASLLQQTRSAWGIQTMEELKEYLKLQYKRNLAVEDYAKKSVTEDEIEKFYKEEIFGDITARHILIKPKTTTDMTPEEQTAKEEEALKTAKEIITKLKNGESFEQLAKDNSDDEASASKGGLLDEFTHGTMTKEFEKAAKNLEVGKYTTEPIKTTYGYHIILKVNQKDKPELKVVKDDIIDEIAQDKLSKDTSLQIIALEKLRKEYKINIQDKNLKTQYENYLTNAKANANNQPQ